MLKSFVNHWRSLPTWKYSTSDLTFLKFVKLKLSKVFEIPITPAVKFTAVENNQSKSKVALAISKGQEV
jgi:hypothetical protein